MLPRDGERARRVSDGHPEAPPRQGRAGDEEGEALTVEKVEKTNPDKLKPFPHDKGLAVSLKYEQRSQEHKFKKPAQGGSQSVENKLRVARM